MKKILLVLIVCALIASFATCPKEEMHKNAFYTEISSAEGDDLSSLFSLIIGNNIKAWETALRLGGYGFQVKDYYFFSLGYLNSAEGSDCRTIGAFGNIWVLTNEGWTIH